MKRANLYGVGKALLASYIDMGPQKRCPTCRDIGTRVKVVAADEDESLIGQEGTVIDVDLDAPCCWLHYQVRFGDGSSAWMHSTFTEPIGDEHD